MRGLRGSCMPGQPWPRGFPLFAALTLLVMLHGGSVAQAEPTLTLTPTTPPFVPSPTPGDPVEAFDSVVARFEASTLTPLTGEPFTLTLIVSLPEGVDIAAWPAIGGEWGPFEIRSAGEMVTEGRKTRQSWTAVLWRPEDVVTPETSVGYSVGGTDIRRVPVREAFFSVPTVIDPDDENLRPALPPILTPWPWPMVALSAGLLCAAGVVLWARRPPPVPDPPPSPSQVALGRLRALSKREPEFQLESALTVLRELHGAVPHAALESAIATGEALSYTGRPISADDAAAYLELATRAVREAAR